MTLLYVSIYVLIAILIGVVVFGVGAQYGYNEKERNLQNECNHARRYMAMILQNEHEQVLFSRRIATEYLTEFAPDSQALEYDNAFSIAAEKIEKCKTKPSPAKITGKVKRAHWYWDRFKTKKNER